MKIQFNPIFLVFSLLIFTACERANPPTLIAHAGGAWQGNHYTNTKQALNENYEKGQRIFELDFNWTTDGHIVCVHDWNRSFKALFSKREAGAITLSEFSKLRTEGGGEPCDFESLAKWMREIEDVSLVTDFKDRNLEGLAFLAENASDLIDRIIPQIYHSSEYEKVSKLGYKKIIFTLYRTDESDNQIVAFVGVNPLWAVTMPLARTSTKLPARLRVLRTEVCTHTVNSRKKAEALRRRGINCLYTDSLSASDF